MSAAAEHEAIEARLHAYFDGALAADDERVVLEHVADCDRCQATLDDLMGMQVALGRSASRSTVASAPSKTDARPSAEARREAPVVSIEPRRARRTWAMAGAA